MFWESSGTAGANDALTGEVREADTTPVSLAEAEATDRGFTEMRLKTHADMPETVGLYERNGWARTDQRGKTVSMRKSLATQ